MSRPDLNRVPEWYHRYISQVTENDLNEAIQKQATDFLSFLASVPADKIDYRYAEGKWTIQEVLQHIIDTERIFAYRALCFARKDTTPLPGFDENSYAEYSKASARNWNEMLKEFEVVRQSTAILFNSFDNSQLETDGIASGKPVYVLGIGFIIVGHINHHVAVIKERYL